MIVKSKCPCFPACRTLPSGKYPWRDTKAVTISERDDGSVVVVDGPFGRVVLSDGTSASEAGGALMDLAAAPVTEVALEEGATAADLMAAVLVAEADVALLDAQELV